MSLLSRVAIRKNVYWGGKKSLWPKWTNLVCFSEMQTKQHLYMIYSCSTMFDCTLEEVSWLNGKLGHIKWLFGYHSPVAMQNYCFVKKGILRCLWITVNFHMTCLRFCTWHKVVSSCLFFFLSASNPYLILLQDWLK